MSDSYSCLCELSLSQCLCCPCTDVLVICDVTVMVDRTEEDVGFLAAVCDTCWHRSYTLGDTRRAELGQHSPTAI